MQVLFDGDVVVYRAGFAAEKTHYYVRDTDGHLHDFTSKRDAESYIDRNSGSVLESSGKEVEPVENAIYNAKSIITSSLNAVGASEDELVVVLSGPTNFRNGVAVTKPYKGNRDPTHRPVHGPDILEYLHKRFDVVVSEDEEADDVLGIYQYDVWQTDPFGSIICSIDKDLDMIPGLHYNFRDEKSYYITEEDALTYFWKQMLVGDTVDNIVGVAGIGPKTAQHLIEIAKQEGEPLADMVRRIYGTYYKEDAENKFLEMGRLLWIRRKAGEWWNPPTPLIQQTESQNAN